jgi:phosphoglycolate phosphatase-like HAD superfamily hydrolase
MMDKQPSPQTRRGNRSTARRKPPLVLDFDGVVCDGIKESLLVVWNGAQGKPVMEFSAQGLGALPPAFVERFTRYRPFAQHLGHFLVPLLEGLPHIGTQEAFEAVYQSIDHARRERFVQAVSQYRQQVRQECPTTWVKMHRCYRGIIPYLSRRNGPVSIVTARDQASVLQLLESKGLTLAPEQVLGEQSPKLAALATIVRQEQVDPSALIFVDDHRSNVQVARQAGYQAYLAQWGYPAPPARGALADPLPAIRLADLLAERFPHRNGPTSRP